MKQRPSIVRLAAVGSALVLVGIFVWHRGGGRIPSDASSNQGNGSGTQTASPSERTRPVMSGSKSLVITPPASAPVFVTQPVEDSTIMPSSKSGRVWSPEDLKQTAPSQVPSPPKP